MRWDCKYHVVIIPKYRKRKLYGELRKRVGEVIRELCRQRGIEFVERQIRSLHLFYRFAKVSNRIYVIFNRYDGAMNQTFTH